MTTPTAHDMREMGADANNLRVRVAQALWQAFHGATTAWPWGARDDGWPDHQEHDRKRFEALADAAIAAMDAD